LELIRETLGWSYYGKRLVGVTKGKARLDLPREKKVHVWRKLIFLHPTQVPSKLHKVKRRNTIIDKKFWKELISPLSLKFLHLYITASINYK
jgi:hypothetical protein